MDFLVRPPSWGMATQIGYEAFFSECSVMMATIVVGE